MKKLNGKGKKHRPEANERGRERKRKRMGKREIERDKERHTKGEREGESDYERKGAIIFMRAKEKERLHEKGKETRRERDITCKGER